MPENTAINDLTQKIVVWATEIATDAAQLPSPEAREAYLLARRRELVAGARREGASHRDATILANACVDGARKIMAQLLARGTSVTQGRA
jgi:hypothetical protein